MYNEKQIKSTLKKLINILEKNKVEYRVMGSIVAAAINGKLHRRIGDIDLIIDRDKKEHVFKELKKLGYKRADGMFAFGRKFLALETLIHEELQSIGYFWGEWKKDGSFFMGNKHFNVQVEARGVEANQYSLCGINFIGIPREAVATGIMSSKHNKKRIKEIELIEEKNIKSEKDDYIHIKILGLPFDFLYHLNTKFFGLLGHIRQKLGLPFDPWRSDIH